MADISIKSSHLETHSRMYKQQSHEVPSGVEPMNTVYRTKEYDLFIVPGLEEHNEDVGKQRDIEEAQVEELIEKIQVDGQLEPILVKPIVRIINGEVRKLYWIVQGQHRFLASKRTNMVIKFIIDEHLTTKDVPRMHTTYQTWNHEDWVKRYLAEGKKSYQTYKDFREKWGTNHDVTLGFLGGESFWDNGGKLKKKFNSGTFYVTKKSLEFAERFIQELFKLKPYMEALHADAIFNDKKLHSAIWKVWYNPAWNEWKGFKKITDKFVNKDGTPKRISEKIERKHSTQEYGKNLEAILNSSVHWEKHISLTPMTKEKAKRYFN